MESQELVQKRPLDYLKIVFRRKWLIVFPTIIGIVGGIVACNVLPKVYESSTLVLVEESKTINPLIKGLAVSTDVAKRLRTLREQILGWDRINQLIKKLDLGKEVRTQQEFEDLVKKLRQNIIVRLRGQNIVGVSYIGNDPVEARDIVKTITDIFITENIRQQTRDTENAISFINDQLELYKKKVKQTDIAGMEEKLNDLLIDSTEKHPMVIELKKKIEASKAELEAGNYEVDTAALGQSDAEIGELREELQRLREETVVSNYGVDEEGGNRARLSTTTDEKLYQLLLLERIDKVTKQDANVNQTLYNELLKRLETAKITKRLEASKEGTRYTLLDPARLPLKPIKPNKLLVLFSGMFIGMCGGLGLVVTTEVFDHSFLGVDELKASFELPVLGAISEIVTQSDVRAKRVRKIKVVGASIVTGAVLLVIIIFNVIIGV